MGKKKELARAQEKLSQIDERVVAIRAELRAASDRDEPSVREARERLDETRAAIAGLETALKDLRRKEQIQQADVVRFRTEEACRRQMLDRIEGLEDGFVETPF